MFFFIKTNNFNFIISYSSLFLFLITLNNFFPRVDLCSGRICWNCKSRFARQENTKWIRKRSWPSCPGNARSRCSTGHFATAAASAIRLGIFHELRQSIKIRGYFSVIKMLAFLLNFSWCESKCWSTICCASVAAFSVSRASTAASSSFSSFASFSAAPTAARITASLSNATGTTS